MNGEKFVDSRVPVPESRSKSDSGMGVISGGERDAERASTVSSDGSNDGQAESSSSVVAIDASSAPLPSEALNEPDRPSMTDGSSHSRGDAGGAGVTTTSAEAKESLDASVSVRRNSPQHCDVKEPTTSAGTDSGTAMTYQSLEDKLRREQAAAPSSGQSAKSGPDTEVGEDEGTAQSAEAPVSSDGPPRIITTKPATSGKKTGQMRRRGKWTVEEEAYVARVIQDFNSGFLDAAAGTTLRTFLSDKLNCDPMRITKKFTGEACIGKRVFHPAIRSPSNATAIDKAQVSSYASTVWSMLSF